MGADPEGQGGMAKWSHPSWEGESLEANSHLVGRLSLACPGPWSGLLLLLHGCHPLAARVGARTSSRALRTRGPSLGKRTHVTDAPSLSELSEEKSGGSDGVGEGSAREGTESGSRAKQAPLFCRIPLFGYRRSSGSPLSPPPTTTRKCRHQTRPSGKLVERRAAGCQHLIAPERWFATAEEPGFHSTAVRHPRTRTAAGPRGLPARCSVRQVQKQQQQ